MYRRTINKRTMNGTMTVLLEFRETRYKKNDISQYQNVVESNIYIFINISDLQHSILFDKMKSEFRKCMFI